MGGVLAAGEGCPDLTDRYFKGIPGDSHASHDPRFLRPEHITDAVLGNPKKLNDLAQSRGANAGADGPGLASELNASLNLATCRFAARRGQKYPPRSVQAQLSPRKHGTTCSRAIAKEQSCAVHFSK